MQGHYLHVGSYSVFAATLPLYFETNRPIFSCQFHWNLHILSFRWGSDRYALTQPTQT